MQTPSQFVPIMLQGGRREEEDAYYLLTRSDNVLVRSTVRAIFGRPCRWQCRRYIPLVINA